MTRDAASSSFWRWLAILAIVNLAARLPLCWDPATVDNDGAEYLAIARFLRTRGEYATDLKWHFYTDDPVIHAAWADRPPLYPLVAVAWQWALPFLDPTAAARVGNSVLACLGLGLAALLLRRLFDERVALLATAYGFLLPLALSWTTQPMTEALQLALTFGALWVWDTAWHGSRTVCPGRCVAAGVLAGLLYLARPTGIVLIVALAIDAVRQRSDPRLGTGARRWWPLLATGAAWAITVAPYHAILALTYGSPFYSALGFTYAVRTYWEVAHYGFERPPPRIGEFLVREWANLPGLILRQCWRHAQAFLHQLGPLLPLLLWSRRADWSDRRLPATALIVGALVLHTLTWSAWGSSRYFLAPIVLLAAMSLAIGARLAPTGEGIAAGLGRWLPRLAGALLVGMLVHFAWQQTRPDRGIPSLPAWREAAAAVRDVRLVASDKPAILNLLLAVPAVRLPRTTDRDQLGRFVERYAPDALVLFADEPGEPAVAAAWRTGGLPPGWQLVHDRGILLIARRVHPDNRSAPGPGRATRLRPGVRRATTRAATTRRSAPRAGDPPRRGSVR